MRTGATPPGKLAWPDADAAAKDATITMIQRKCDTRDITDGYELLGQFVKLGQWDVNLEQFSLKRRFPTITGQPMIRSICLMLALTTAIGSTAGGESPDATWSQWRGPDRDSRWNGSRWPETLDGLSLRWKQTLGPSYSGPVTDGTRVYTTETVDNTYERVSAIDLQTGQSVWTNRWDDAMAVPFFAAANGSWIRATPVISGDSLVVLGMRDRLVHLNAETGDIRWQVSFTEKLGSKLPAFGAVCSPIVDGGAIYVQTGGPTVKLSLETGDVIWKTLDSVGNAGMSGGAFSSPVIATIGGVRQLVVQTRTELCGVSLESGEVLYREPIQAYRGMNILTPTVIGDSIFTAAHSGTSQLFDIKRDGATWSIDERWQENIQGYMSSPVVVEGTIYLHAKNQRVVAIDAAQGDRLWTSSPMGKYQSMATQGDRILILDQTGKLLLVKANREELEIVSEKQVAEDSWAHLAVFEGGVIVRDLAALKVYAWE